MLSASVRIFRNNDLIKAGNIVKRSMKPSLEGLPLSAAQEILSRYHPKNFRKKVSGGTFWVVEDAGSQKILGIIGLADGNRVTTFYVDPKYQGEGVGRLLFDRLEQEVLKRGCRTLVTRSSPVAEEVYKHLGFKSIRKEWKTYEGGRKSYNVWMEKKLA